MAFCLIRTITLSVVSYECETWSLKLGEERRLRVFENRVLSRIFGPKRDEVTVEWRKLHNEELSDLYPSPNIIPVSKQRNMRWAEHVAPMGRAEMYTGLWWGNLRDRPRRRWEDNIKMDLHEMGCGGTDWIELAHDRDSWRVLVNAVMNLRVP